MPTLTPRKARNAERRAPYRALAEVECPGGPVGLCCFCKFGKREGEGCVDSYVVCQHPLPAISESERDSGEWTAGEDCWGFRPYVSFEVAADLVGFWLRRLAVDTRTIPMVKEG